jgi:hypothetical protein
MRKGKQVRVVNRWRADEFDGEIPIGGDDEEMLGTAMKMANGVGQIQGIVEDTQPFWAPAVYHAFYTGGGFVTGNALAALLTKDEDKKPDSALKFFAARAGYLGGSGVLNVLGNGLPGTAMEKVQASSLFLGTGLLAFWREGVVTGTLDKTALYGGIGGLGMASLIYAIRKTRGL